MHLTPSVHPLFLMASPCPGMLEVSPVISSQGRASAVPWERVGTQVWPVLGQGVCKYTSSRAHRLENSLDLWRLGSGDGGGRDLSLVLFLDLSPSDQDVFLIAVPWPGDRLLSLYQSGRSSLSSDLLTRSWGVRGCRLPSFSSKFKVNTHNL